MDDSNEKLSGLKTILQKAQAFCAYQERCTHEMAQKLREWKVDEDRIPNIIEDLTKEKFLNDLRFTQTYVSSKFRLNKWGKIKLAYELRMKKIPDALISQGLEVISEDEYREAIQALIAQKAREVKDTDAYARKQKIARFLVSKGYETDLVFGELKRLVKD